MADENVVADEDRGSVLREAGDLESVGSSVVASVNTDIERTRNEGNWASTLHPRERSGQGPA